MEYYIAKGKRRREERAAASTAETYRPSSFQLTDTKSLETSTTSHTLITTSSYDDSDDELGAEIYRSSLTAKRHLEEQQQALSTSIQTTTIRRKSSRLENTKSKEDAKKKSIVFSKPASTDNEKITNKIIRSKRKTVEISAAEDDVCKEVADNIKRVIETEGIIVFAHLTDVPTLL